MYRRSPEAAVATLTLSALIYVLVQPHVVVKRQKFRFAELGQERQIGKAVQRQTEAFQSRLCAAAAFLKMTDAFAHPVRCSRKENLL